MAYKVKLKQFEGPFDLLVYLIENAKMNIYDIKISEITRQYIEYIDSLKELEVEIATEFMILAASLLEIKSKMLLPKMAIDGTTILEEDPRKELVEKLIEYRKFKEISEIFGEQELYGRSIFSKPQEDLTSFTNDADEYLKLDIDQFVIAFNKFLLKKKKEKVIKNDYEQRRKVQISIEEKLQFIKKLFELDESKEVDFYNLVKERENKYDVALSFSSMLELVKQESLWANQNAIFGPITIGATEKLKTIKAIEDRKVIDEMLQV